MRSKATVAVSILVAAIAMLALLPAGAGAQGNSSIDQYIEKVPDAKGGKPAKDRDSSSAGSGGGGESSDGSQSSGDDGSGGGSGSADDSGDSKKGSKKKDKKDKGDDESADPTGGDRNGPGGGSQTGTLALERVPGGAASADSGGSGPLLALIVLLAVGAAGAFAYYRFIWRRRGGQSEA